MKSSVRSVSLALSCCLAAMAFGAKLSQSVPKGWGEDFAAAREALGDLARSEEDVMSYICFPSQAEAFLTQRKEKEENVVKYTIEEA